MKTIKIVLITVLSFISCKMFGQSEFDLNIKSNKLTIEDFVKSQLKKRSFQFDVSYYRIIYRDKFDNNVYGNWEYQFDNTALKEYWFMNKEIPYNEEKYKLFLAQAQKTVEEFTRTFGKPIKIIDNIKVATKLGEQKQVMTILKALWIINGERLIVNYSVDGEHSDFWYRFEVHRFYKEHFGVAINNEWDGF